MDEMLGKDPSPPEKFGWFGAIAAFVFGFAIFAVKSVFSVTAEYFIGAAALWVAYFLFTSSSIFFKCAGVYLAVRVLSCALVKRETVISVMREDPVKNPAMWS
jgi:hypothetical protein